MGRGRNQKRPGKGDAKTQNRVDKFADVEDRFERLDVESKEDSNENSEESENSENSSSEQEDEVRLEFLSCINLLINCRFRKCRVKLQCSTSSNVIRKDVQAENFSDMV